MRIIVCGGRRFGNTHFAYAVLDELHAATPVTGVIDGGATGADLIGNRWAFHRGVSRTTVPAEWQEYGRAAGPLRNKKMLDLKPDLVVAFPGGRGTENMIALAEKAGVRVVRALPSDDRGTE